MALFPFLVLQCVCLLHSFSLVISLNTRDDIINLINNMTQLEQMVRDQGRELATTKTALDWAIRELQSTNDELLAMKSELQRTTTDLIGIKSNFDMLGDTYKNETNVLSSELLATEAELASVKSNLVKMEDKQKNETRELSDKLSGTEVDLTQTTYILSMVQTELNSTETKLNSTNVHLDMNSDNIQSLANSMTHDLDALGDKCHNETQDLSDKLAKTEAELRNTRSSLTTVQAELNATKTILNYTNFRTDANSAGIKTVKEQMKLDLDALEDKCQNDTHKLSLKLAQTEAELTNTTRVLTMVQTDLISTNTELNSTKHLLDVNVANMKSLKDQLTNITHLSNLRNIGFVMSSKGGDNGIPHSNIVYDVIDNSTLVFSQTTLNKGNAFTIKNGIMTAPVTGIYVLWVDIQMERRNLTVRLVKSPDGETVSEKQSGGSRVAFSTPVYLNAGETVAVQIVGENVLFHTTPASEFGGVLVRAF